MAFYNRKIQQSLSGKVLEGECSNYYRTATGRNVVTYPWSDKLYWLLTRLSWLSTATYAAPTAPRRHMNPARALTPGSSEPAATTPANAMENAGA